MPKTKGDRYSISVSGRTYGRLRAAVPHGSLASCVDEFVMDALEDPAILERIIGTCRVRPTYS